MTLQTIVAPHLYTDQQIQLAMLIAAALHSRRFLLLEPPENPS